MPEKGFLMSDESATTTEATAEVTESAQVEGTETAPQNDGALPEWAREKLSKANSEAAKYRTRAKEAAEKAQFEAEERFNTQLKELTDAKAGLETELNNTRLNLVKVQAALSVGIPGESATEFAGLLQGTTEEEISSHAAKVKELFAASNKPEPAVDPSQGRQSYVPLNGDPLLDLVKSKLGID